VQIGFEVGAEKQEPHGVPHDRADALLLW
jgi:hypothetical protein